MDHSTGNKRPNVNSLNENSPKTQKMDQTHKGPSSSKNTFKFTSASSLINSKWSNIYKMRQQLVEEMKNIEFPLKETIKNLKIKISEVIKEANNISDEMKKENALVCNQRELNAAKDEEHKILREKLEELYEYHKVILENITDISKTLEFNHALIDQVTNMFNSILIMQENDIKMLEEKLTNVTPDEKYIIKLNEINSKISEQEKELTQNMNEINQLELKIKEAKIHSEEEKQKITQFDQKIDELEKKNETLKTDGLKQKNDLLNEVEILKQEVNVDKIKLADSDSKVSELKSKLEINRNDEKELEKILSELNKEIDLLSKEKEELDKQKCEYDQQNQITLEQRKKQLEIAQNELNSIEEKQNQATDILQKNISDMHNKLKPYGDTELKLKKIEVEIEEEEESLKQITKECELKKKTLTDEIKLHYDKINKIKTKISKVEHGISEDEKKVKALEKEILEINQKIGKNLKETEKNEIRLSENISQYTNIKLPEFKDLGKSENKTRRQLYNTSTISDDMDIDSLPSLDEQYVQLTQSKSSSPEKKFFKHSQSKTKRDSTPRTKGRSKNN